MSKLGIILSIVLLIVLVIVVAVLLTNEGANAEGSTPGAQEKQSGELLTLEDVLEGKLAARRFNGSWLSDNEIMYRDELETSMLYNIESGKSSVLLEKEILSEGLRVDVSADRKYLLIAHVVEKV